MAKSKTTLKAGDNLPARGMSNKNRILEALRLESFEGLRVNATKEDVEIAFFRHIVKRATDPKESESTALLKVLADKGWSNVKPVYEAVNFQFDSKASPVEQCGQVMKAVAEGTIPADIGQIFISSISSMMKIEEVTDIARRLDQIEKALSIGNG